MSGGEETDSGRKGRREQQKQWERWVGTAPEVWFSFSAEVQKPQ